MNLPKYMRNKPDALILYGVVPSRMVKAGKRIEPDLTIYRDLMVSELIELCSTELYSQYSKAPIRVKVSLLLYMMDFQGYSKYFHMSGAASYLPCNICLIRATR